MNYVKIMLNYQPRKLSFYIAGGYYYRIFEEWPMSCTVLLAKSDSAIMFCKQSYQGLIIDRSLVY